MITTFEFQNSCPLLIDILFFKGPTYIIMSIVIIIIEYQRININLKCRIIRDTNDS